MGKALDLLRSLFPRMETPFQDTQEVAGEVERQEATTEQSTEPLEREVILGPIFPGKTAERRMIEIAEGLRRGLIKGMGASLTFHTRGGLNLDVTIRKPYRLRRYKGDCIVRVYEEHRGDFGTKPPTQVTEKDSEPSAY